MKPRKTPRKRWEPDPESRAMPGEFSPWDRVGDDISLTAMAREVIAEKLVDVIMWIALVFVFASIEMREWWRPVRETRRTATHGKRPALSEKTGSVAKTRTIIDEMPR